MSYASLHTPLEGSMHTEQIKLITLLWSTLAIHVSGNSGSKVTYSLWSYSWILNWSFVIWTLSLQIGFSKILRHSNCFGNPVYVIVHLKGLCLSHLLPLILKAQKKEDKILSRHKKVMFYRAVCLDECWRTLFSEIHFQLLNIYEFCS